MTCNRKLYQLFLGNFLLLKPRADGSEAVPRLAEVFASVSHWVGVVDDQLATADGNARILQWIDLLLDERVVLVDLLEPAVTRSWPAYERGRASF